MLINKEILGLLNQVVVKRNTIPVLSHALIQAGKIHVTDMDNSLSIPVQAKGSCLIKLSLLKPAKYEIIGKGKITALKDTARSLTYNTPMKVSDFPMMPTKIEPSIDNGFGGKITDKKKRPTLGKKVFLEFTLSRKELQEIIGQVSFCMSDEFTRYYLNGIFYDNGVFVATDGHRLAHYTSRVKAKGKMIISAKSISILKTILKTYPENKKIHITANAQKVNFSFENNVSLTSRLVDGTYPDYTKVIPDLSKLKPSEKVVHEFNKKEGSEAVEIICDIMGKEKFCPIKITQEGNFTAFNIHDDVNFSRKISKLVSRKKMLLTFNGRYLKELLSNMPSSASKVTFEIKDGCHPAIFRADGFKNAFWIIMPMRD